MSLSRRAPGAFRLISEQPGVRFLGLTVAERNRRVARRCGAADTQHDTLPTLTVPADVVITPALLQDLPAANGRLELIWHPDRPPLVWSAAGGGGAPRRVRLQDGVVLDASTRMARHTSAWKLLRVSGKPGDGWLSRHVHRRISRVFSYALLYLGLSANIATLLTFAIGAVAAWLMAQTTHATMIVGALLYWCSSIADGIDGEMARLTLSESSFGEQLDTGVDQATHLLAFAGAGVGWWRQGVGPAGAMLAVAAAIGLPAMLLWAMSMVRRARGEHRFFVPTKPLELAVAGAARHTGAAPLQISAGIFVLFRREVFSFTFLLVSLVTGLRVIYPALVVGGLVVVAATLLLYRTPVAAALQTAVRS